MNDKQFENKVNRDIDRTKQDLATLGDDGVTGFARTIEKLSDTAGETASEAVKAINMGVQHGLTQYNEKVQDFADRLPGSLGKNAAGYPWVTVTLSLAVGMLLGVLLKPSHRVHVGG